ncbi:TPA: hypothetical protein ENX78_09075 [Candidatus Poribacteria bacterium]|nr:hypothetical protein [Candidatus Poribacteria bacterium]
MERDVHLRDYLLIIRKHDFVVIISFLLIFGSALIVALYMPRVYEATATIEIQQATSPSGLNGIMQGLISRGTDQVSMETICRRFVSNSLLNNVIRNLKVRSLDTYKDLSPEFLAPKISAKIVPDTKMIEVSVKMRRDEGGSQRAANIVNELIVVMQNQRQEKTASEIDHQQNFIDEKVKDVESQLENSDKDIRNFLKNKGDAITWSLYADYIFNRLKNLIEIKETNEFRLEAEQKKLADLKSRISKEPEFIEYSRTLSQDALWNKYRTDQADLNLKLIEAKSESGLGSKNPKIESIQSQIDQLNDKMKSLGLELMNVSSKTESRNPTYESLARQIIESELNILAYSVSIDSTDKLIKQLNAEKERIFSEMPENQYNLDKMNREIGYKLDIYKNLLTKKIESEIANLQSSENISKVKGGIEIIDLAQPVSRPISPRIKFIMVIAGIVGLAVGLSMAFLIDYFEKISC